MFILLGLALIVLGVGIFSWALSLTDGKETLVQLNTDKGVPTPIFILAKTNKCR